jgi:UDP-N-acetylglucosamine 3-dehydrogenase
MLRLGIIGVGWAGTRQAQAAEELGSEVEIRCLVDSDEAHLREVAAELAVANTHTDYREALADPELDAVSICLPHALHCPVAIEAANAGKHVLCEKPLAMAVAEGRAMLRAADANDAKLYCAESAVYAPLPKALRALVSEGRHIGEMTAAVCVKGFRGLDYGYPGRRAWLAEPGQGGSGTWLLHGIHSVAAIRYIFGEVVSVFAREHKTHAFVRRDVEGTVSVLLGLATGSSVHLIQTPETKVKGPAGGYMVYGTEGSVRAYGNTVELLADDGTVAEVITCPASELSSFAQEVRAFAQYVEDDVPGPTTGASELRSLAVVEAGYESMRTGKPIDLSERYPDLWEAE